jgi:hypothetical protein
MLKKMKAKARGGMARGGMQSAGVGATIGQWAEDWFLGWLGLADGGEVAQAVADLPESEQDKIIREAKKDLLKAVKSGEVDLPASAPSMARGGMQSAGVGSTVGQWVEDWLVGWLGLARGGQAMARGGMARGHSVFR